MLSRRWGAQSGPRPPRSARVGVDLVSVSSDRDRSPRGFVPTTGIPTYRERGVPRGPATTSRESRVGPDIGTDGRLPHRTFRFADLPETSGGMTLHLRHPHCRPDLSGRPVPRPRGRLVVDDGVHGPPGNLDHSRGARPISPNLLSPGLNTPHSIFSQERHSTPPVSVALRTHRWCISLKSGPSVSGNS